MTGWQIFITFVTLLYPTHLIPPSLPTTPALLNPAPVSMVSLDDQQIRNLVIADPHSLGSISLGFPSGGILLNGRQMTSCDMWEVVNPAESWGTEETVSFIETAIHTVNALYPDTPPLHIGDISTDDGGRLNRHKTHQCGRDADLGFYFKDGWRQWRARGSLRNLDLARNWALVRALVVHTDVEAILLDRRIQKILYDYAVSIGEDQDWLREVFQCPRGSTQSIVRHVPKHADHYHVRFFNRRAQEMGIRAYPTLLDLKQVKPPVVYAHHRVRSGQTLGYLARRYGVTVRSIQRANNMHGTMLRAGRSYRVPIRDGVSRLPDSLTVPERRLPPSVPPTLAAVDWTPAPHPVQPLAADAMEYLAALGADFTPETAKNPDGLPFPLMAPAFSEIMFWYMQEWSDSDIESGE